MFVAHCEPGNIPELPALTSAPIWLELHNVPLQFFNEDGFERIAGLVGEPKYLHPSTANKADLEVAKVLTIIDPRQPLPEAVNVQFDSKDIARVGVSSLWMPPVCSHCKEIGHSIKRCPTSPITCADCKSTSHSKDNCPRAKEHNSRKYKKQKEKSKATFPGKSVHPQKNHAASIPPLRSSSSGNPQGNLEASCKGKGVAVSTNTRHTAAGFSDPSRISLKGIHIEQPESSNVNVTTSVSEVNPTRLMFPHQIMSLKKDSTSRSGKSIGPEAVGAEAPNSPKIIFLCVQKKYFVGMCGVLISHRIGIVLKNGFKRRISFLGA
ncbi:unnamed protein product [Brassica oleracea]|uniref:(rape) hypothetical protein n=1 Tax=Brassica napus TaxID=3708 RepID=A0A816JJ22_BRANA|nr:unnamed protein product [Brassica napus]